MWGVYSRVGKRGHCALQKTWACCSSALKSRVNGPIVSEGKPSVEHRHCPRLNGVPAGSMCWGLSHQDLRM